MTRLLMRPFRKSIGAQILAGYGITTLFALVVAAISIYAVVAVNSRLAEIAENDRLVGANVGRIRLALEQQNDAIRSYLAPLRDEDRDPRDLEAFYTAGADLRGAVEELRGSFTDESGVDLIDEVVKRHRRFEEVAESELSLLRQGWPGAAQFLWRVSGKESKDDLERAVLQLAEKHEAQTRLDVDEASRQSLLALIISLGLVLGGGCGAFLLGRRMTARITNRLEVLAAQADALRSGDLSARVPPLGQDELALLGNELNRMAADLEESHQRLAQALRETRQREDELRVLNSIAATVSRSLDLDEILHESLDQVCELLGIEAADVMLVDEATGELSTVANRGFSEEIMRDMARLKSTELVAGAVALTGEPVVIDDIGQDPHPSFEQAVREGYRAFASVPMCSKERAVGVMNVATRQARRFTATEVTLLSAIGNQIALAIENARLYRQARSFGVAEERNRMAREIHDTLAQGLTAITLQLEWAEAVLEEDIEQARSGLSRALSTARDNLEEARRSVMDLRAAPLEGLSLAEALRRLVDTFGREHEIAAVFVADRMTDRFSARVEASLYRIAQEALTNVAKHACADNVTVELTHEHGRVRLVVEDDGVGFDACQPVRSDASGGFGLVGLRERAALLGGSLQVESVPGRGTRLEVDVPDGERARRASTAARVGRSATPAGVVDPGRPAPGVDGAARLQPDANGVQPHASDGVGGPAAASDNGTRSGGRPVNTAGTRSEP